MTQTSLDLRPGAAQTKTSMEDLNAHQNAPVSNPNVETTQVSPSPSSDDFDSAIGETIVCALFPRIDTGNFTQNDPTEQDGHRNTTPVRRSISFDEVFQNGKAPVKRIIIQFDGSWFIL
ncbi:hypothetical protein BGZ61DRAFT_485730 [Ilyonectria robusta]|uniref:uncharacterized protein n=1 Tax=Ilyonectria robusta TaxID=1079257 RepID=UPI001E8D2FF0|nr:uncharacterized protein BGZ61DRAFT_485730 [Ilyonectria robusta]KAH8659762.1 hypothetical protein BGZ61DRAFT_485730 [Ilyonectria robusta]